MKKILALVLTLVIALSVVTVASAAMEETYTCPVCGASTTVYADYKEHIEGGCNLYFFPCQYGCGVGFANADELADHEVHCWNGSATCDYCGKTFSPVIDYNEHLDACKAKHFNIPVAKIRGAIEDFIRNQDWNNLIGKVVDGFNTVIDTVAGFIFK